MSTKANPVLIGTFVLSGIAIAIIGIVLFAGASYFSSKETFIMYFKGSVNGLEIGSPVKFKGVEIGRVRDIKIFHNQTATVEAYMPVFVEIDGHVLDAVENGPMNLSSRDALELAIGKGLRAKLEMTSFLTGRLFVNFDYYPDAGEPLLLQRTQELKEIPTTESTFTKFIESFREIDLPGIASRVESILDRIDQGMADVEFKRINDGVIQALDSLNTLASRVEIVDALKAFQSAAENADALLGNLGGEVGPVMKSADNAIIELSRTLEEARLVFADLKGFTSVNSPFGAQLIELSAELSNAAKSVRVLSEYLTRNPDSLLKGNRP